MIYGNPKPLEYFEIPNHELRIGSYSSMRLAVLPTKTQKISSSLLKTISSRPLLTTRPLSQPDKNMTAATSPPRTTAPPSASTTSASSQPSAGAPSSADPKWDSFWSTQLSKQSREEWYQKAIDYWHKQPSTVNGVLGGFGQTSGPDLRESKRLLQLLAGKKTCCGGSSSEQASPEFAFGSVLDCGAGIGRISEGLLLEQFERVEVLEPCENLIEEARKRLVPKGVEHFHVKSLQDFEFRREGGEAMQ